MQAPPPQPELSSFLVLTRSFIADPNTSLQRLSLYSGLAPKKASFDGRVWKLLGHLTALRSLSFGDRQGGLAALKDDAFAHLTSLPQLTHLDLSYCFSLTEKGLVAFLPTLTNLRALAMRSVLLYPYSSRSLTRCHVAEGLKCWKWQWRVSGRVVWWSWTSIPPPNSPPIVPPNYSLLAQI